MTQYPGHRMPVTHDQRQIPPFRLIATGKYAVTAALTHGAAFRANGRGYTVAGR